MKEVLSREVPRVPALRGTTIVTLFYENSHAHAGVVRARGQGAGRRRDQRLPPPAAASTKGESLVDTVKTLQAVGADVLVMRH